MSGSVVVNTGLREQFQLLLSADFSALSVCAETQLTIISHGRENNG